MPGRCRALPIAVFGGLNVWAGWTIVVLGAALLAGVAVGLGNALLIVFFRVPSLAAALGTISPMSGPAQWITDPSGIIGVSGSLEAAVAGGRFPGVPYAFPYALLAGVVRAGGSCSWAAGASWRGPTASPWTGCGSGRWSPRP